MHPPSFTGSRTTEDLENFIEEPLKVIKAMDIIDAERVESVACQLKNFSRTWFEQWKKGKAEGAPFLSWDMFEEAFRGSFFPQELREAKVRDFLTLKQYYILIFFSHP